MLLVGTGVFLTIGTGNIVGVATALVAGGPGALVWMELAALAGLSTKLPECLLAVKFRSRNRRGQMSGGPMYVMRDGLGLGRLGAAMGAAYALFAVCSSFGIGGMAQANSIAGAVEASLGVPVYITALATAGLALAVILGGVQSVAQASAAVRSYWEGPPPTRPAWVQPEFPPLPPPQTALPGRGTSA